VESGDRWERDETVKKDIFAALTFIMVGLLFYMVQSDSKMDQLLSSGMECEAESAAVVSESTPETPSEFTLQDEGTRDS
jgi:hypothetical protein